MRNHLNFISRSFLPPDGRWTGCPGTEFRSVGNSLAEKTSAADGDGVVPRGYEWCIKGCWSHPWCGVICVLYIYIYNTYIYIHYMMYMMYMVFKNDMYMIIVVYLIFLILNTPYMVPIMWNFPTKPWFWRGCLILEGKGLMDGWLLGWWTDDESMDTLTGRFTVCELPWPI